MRVGAARLAAGAAILVWLAAAPATAQQDDYAAGPGTAGRLEVGEPAAGRLERAGDIDWFAVELTAGVRYALDQEGLDTRQGTLADPLLVLHDRNGDPIGRSDDGGTGLNARLLIEPDRDGTYYLAAGAYGDATGTYTVTVVEYPGFEDDVGDTPQDAARIAVGDSVAGRLEVPGDTDLYGVTLQAGTAYVIDLEGRPTGQGTLSDPLVVLLGAAGGEVARDDDGGEGLNSRLSFTPGKTGEFHISAGGYAAASGSYRLTVREASAQRVGK
jgi:hypothetical protein